MALTDLPRVAMLARAVFPLHGLGGVERHVFHLVTHLTKLGVPVHLLVQPWQAVSSSFDLASQALLKHELVTIYTIRYDRTSPVLRPNSIVGRQLNYPLFSMLEARKAAQLVYAEQVDVIHTQGLCALGWSVQRRRDWVLQAVPFVANPHGMEEYKGPDWRKRLAYTPFRVQYSWAHRQADRVIATDDCTSDDVPQLLGVQPKRVSVIPSAIDVNESLGLVNAAVRQELRERFQLDQVDLTLLTVSRLERNKGYHHLLTALHQLRSELPQSWRLLMVGQGKAEQQLKQQAQELGLEPYVRFTGRLDDQELHSLYAEVDLFVHPTLYEGSSLVTLEAMIHELPVIATAAGGIPDKVFSGRNGLIVPPDNPQALAHALRLALQLREYWPEWGRQSAQIVRSTFDWPLVARKTLHLYQELLGRTPSG